MLLVVIVADSDWFVVVCRCKPENVTSFLVDFYRFVEGINGVKSLHFLIRDRIEDEVVFSFRVLVETKQAKAIKSKISYKLKRLLPLEKYAINPSSESGLFKYVAWSTERAAKIGEEKFAVFCDFLSKMSRMVLEMAERKYFDTSERVEFAHVMAWMLGCTEYGLLSTKHFEVGYYDRIADKSCPYLREVFQKQA
jgi:hypothetical protein